MEWYIELYRIVLKGHEPYLVKRKHAAITSDGYETDLNFQDWTSPKYPPSVNVHEAPESRCDPRATRPREQVGRYADGANGNPNFLFKSVDRPRNHFKAIRPRNHFKAIHHLEKVGISRVNGKLKWNGKSSCTELYLRDMSRILLSANARSPHLVDMKKILTFKIGLLRNIPRGRMCTRHQSPDAISERHGLENK